MSFRPRHTVTPAPARPILVFEPGQLWCTEHKIDLVALSAALRPTAHPVLVTDATGQPTTTPVPLPVEATTSTPARNVALVTAAAVAALALAQLALRHFRSSRTVGRRSR